MTDRKHSPTDPGSELGADYPYPTEQDAFGTEHDAVESDGTTDDNLTVAGTDGHSPRATQLDMGQTVALLVTAMIFMFVTVYVDWIWAKVIVLILMILLVVGLSLRIYRDRVGK